MNIGKEKVAKDGVHACVLRIFFSLRSLQYMFDIQINIVIVYVLITHLKLAIVDDIPLILRLVI